MTYDYLVVGAGLFGAVFAHEAAARGHCTLVIDRRQHVGGNIYTEPIEGIEVHRYGAHIFHTSDRRVWDYVNRFADFRPYVHSPLAVFRGEVFNLPFNMNTFSRMWDIRTPEEAREKIRQQIEGLQIREPRNLEEQALSMVGTDLYEKLVKGYTEKQWGRSCRDLPAFLIRRLPLRFTYDNNYFSDRYQGIPENGYTELVEKLLEGCEVRTGTDYTEYRKTYGRNAGKTVFTGMIDEYFDYCLGTLQYRSLRFETEVLDMENFQGCAVVNYTEREIPYTRIIEHTHFSGKTRKKTVITREFPMEWEKGLEPYYPVNDEKNGRLYEQYRHLAEEEKDVLFGGRLGSYRYCDMDQTVAAALKAADEEFSEE